MGAPSRRSERRWPIFGGALRHGTKCASAAWTLSLALDNEGLTCALRFQADLANARHHTFADAPARWRDYTIRARKIPC
jgi:hypothetical protein